MYDAFRGVDEPGAEAICSDIGGSNNVPIFVYALF